MDPIITYLFLGVIQGITEWLPISSSAVITLIMTNFLGITDIEVILRSALFLHLGTFFAALIYFRKDVKDLFRTFFKYKNSTLESKKILNFIILTTFISGTIGLIILKLLPWLFNNVLIIQNEFELVGKVISLFVAILLLVTGTIQIKIKKGGGLKTKSDIKGSDTLLAGFAQGIAALPGISRSGMTLSALLLKKFDDTSALRLSFLMSLPVVLIGNIFLNINQIIFTPVAIAGVLASFVFGLLTIHTLMKVSKKVNFGWFVIFFGLLMLVGILF